MSSCDRLDICKPAQIDALPVAAENFRAAMFCDHHWISGFWLDAGTYTVCIVCKHLPAFPWPSQEDLQVQSKYNHHSNNVKPVLVMPHSDFECWPPLTARIDLTMLVRSAVK